MVSTAAPLYSFLRNRSEAKTKTPILSENQLILKHGSFIFHFFLTYSKNEKIDMVHLEMSYLTHSKFPIMIIPDILPPVPCKV